MRQGFIFNYDLCVACNACAAACFLENKGDMPWRTVLTTNPDAYPALPVHNLSLACNHCENPVCMHSCPAGAYGIDDVNGVVLIDDKKCIGCNYCSWNCPYDAPQYNKNKGTIEKCNMCIERLKEDIQPACTAACPTGALAYGIIEGPSELAFNLPDTDLDPALRINGPSINEKYPDIIPEEGGSQLNTRSGPYKKKIKTLNEWPLMVFSFLSSLLFALLFSAWNGSLILDTYLFSLMLIINGIVSMIHLGKPYRAYRAIINYRSSPLSREIIFYSLFSVFSVSALLFDYDALWLSGLLSGLMLLLSIDSIYSYSDKSYKIRYHSGLTFLTALMMSSLFIGEALPFLFILLIRLIYLLAFKYRRDTSLQIKLLVTAYIAYMIYLAASLLGKRPVILQHEIVIYLVFEFIMRVIFYFDFSPISIRFDFSKKSYQEQYEKEES